MGTSDWTVAFWIRPSALATSTKKMLGNGGTAAGTEGWHIYQGGGGNIGASLSDGTTWTSPQISTGGSLTAGVWKWVVVGWDRNASLTIRVNNQGAWTSNISSYETDDHVPLLVEMLEDGGSPRPGGGRLAALTERKENHHERKVLEVEGRTQAASRTERCRESPPRSPRSAEDRPPGRGGGRTSSTASLCQN
jgi:hypothetical protein